MNRFVASAVVALGALGLVGCTSSGEDARSACLREAGVIGHYGDARDSSGPINEVVDEAVASTDPKDEDSLAHDVFGTASVRIGESWRDATWSCFTQVVDGKRHTALIGWRPQ